MVEGRTRSGDARKSLWASCQGNCSRTRNSGARGTGYVVNGSLSIAMLYHDDFDSPERRPWGKCVVPIDLANFAATKAR